MSPRYVAFDIETATDVPGEGFDWEKYRPLGISCAATFAHGEERPRLWHGKTPSGKPAERMSREDAEELVEYLAEMVQSGHTVLTWNGLGFDFNVLAEESGAVDQCKKLARGHVDMMFHVLCELGYPVALDKAARGMGLPGKPKGMSGVQAPAMWLDGQHQKVLDYVAQDVRITLQLAEACRKQASFKWITRKGSRSDMPLDRGWLRVEKALKLPTPDTSWMSSPLSRNEFTGWLSAK
jgi:hypothetical protein